MKNIENSTYEQCIKFLSENFGLRGFNKSGITLKTENRTLENLRKECEIQKQLINN